MEGGTCKKSHVRAIGQKGVWPVSGELKRRGRPGPDKSWKPHGGEFGLDSKSNWGKTSKLLGEALEVLVRSYVIRFGFFLKNQF